jgi:hypothetical protein
VSRKPHPAELRERPVQMVFDVRAETGNEALGMPEAACSGSGLYTAQARGPLFYLGGVLLESSAAVIASADVVAKFFLLVRRVAVPLGLGEPGSRPPCRDHGHQIRTRLSE